MNHIRRGLLISLVLLAPVAPASRVVAQDSIRVTLFRPPPNQLKVADLWRIRIDNRTSNTLTVYLFGRADEARDGAIVDATCAHFSLPPGIKIVSGAEIQPIDANYYNQRYKDIFLRTGLAPTGNYRVCVTVRNARTDADLATDCYDQRVEVTNPPILVMPRNESRVDESRPAFTWLPPTPIARGAKVTYRLRIVEILGRQTAYDAMMSNPAWFERAPIPNTVFAYPVASRPFATGHRYAWQVIAADGTFPMGESEIWWFTFDPTTGPGRDDGSGRGRGGTGIGAGGGGATGPPGGGTGIGTRGADGSRWTFTFTDKGMQIFDLGGSAESDAPYGFNRIPGAELFPNLELAVPPAVMDALLTPCLTVTVGPVFRRGAPLESAPLNR